MEINKLPTNQSSKTLSSGELQLQYFKVGSFLEKAFKKQQQKRTKNPLPFQML